MQQNVNNYPIPIDTFFNLFSPYLASIGVIEEITHGNVFINLFESLKYHFMIIFVNHPDIELVEKLLVAYDNRRGLITPLVFSLNPVVRSYWYLRGLLWIAINYPKNPIQRDIDMVIEGAGLGLSSSIVKLFKEYFRM